MGGVYIVNVPPIKYRVLMVVLVVVMAVVGK